MRRIILNLPEASTLADLCQLASNYFSPQQVKRFRVQALFKIEDQTSFQKFPYEYKKSILSNIYFLNLILFKFFCIL